MNNIIGRLTNPDLIFLLPAIIIGITIHEFSHAMASYKLGDPTPKLQGRLSLNPLAHIDPFGLITLLVFGFGWGRPVQIDPRYYKNPSKDRVLVSIAGPLSNFILLVVVSLIMRFTIGLQIEWLWKIGIKLIQINAVLCVFNLLPLPPLDGSKILLELLPIRDKYMWYYKLQQYAMPIFLILMITDILGIILNPFIQLLLRISYLIMF